MDSAATPAGRDPRPRMERMEELFHEALKTTPDQREPLVRASCPDDPALGDEVLGLLLAESAISELKSASGGPVQGPATFDDGHGDRWCGCVLGGYRLERLLGRGGMGVVYLAYRSAGNLSQRVAVKLMAYHLQSTPAQAQFLLERQALAELDHPHITRLLDGGVTPEGLPYLVMEYVEGRRLDAVCDAEGATLTLIAQLMLQLCEAVSYVHRNLILHRDLKPGNVMVTEEGSVKLLDFGTLKGLGARFAGDSDMTRAGMRSLTLRYASPEQICGELASAAASTTASTAIDVFSLGMILDRLIAGHLPHETADLSLPELVKVLERERFAPPSRSGPADRRELDPLLAADLDAIALKAIRYRPADRYDSAAALAADLTRALEHRPVSARVGSAGYRARLFLRRNLTLAAGGVALLVVLAAGLGVMAHERNIAREQSRRAVAGIEEEQRLTHVLLFDYFAQLKQIPGSTDAQRRAVGQALAYLQSLSPEDMTPELQLESIQAYVELGNLQESGYDENLGDLPGAIRTLGLAESSAARLVAEQPDNARYLRSQAAAERSLGAVYLTASRPGDAITRLLKAQSIYTTVAARTGQKSADFVQAAGCADQAGDSYGLPGAGSLMDPARALRSYQDAQSLDKAGAAHDPQCMTCRRGVAIEDWKMGGLLGFTDEAAGYYRDGLAIFATLTPAQRTATPNRRLETLLLQNLGLLYADTGRMAEALPLLDQVQDRMRAAVAADPMDARARMDLALFDDDLADAYANLHQYNAQLEPSREFLAMMDVLARKDPTNDLKQFRRGKALSHYGSLELQLGNVEEGRRYGLEAVGILVPLTRKTTAGARVLDITADALLAFHPEPATDGALAVELAERAVTMTPQPGVEQYLALARAQRYAGLRGPSVQSAQSALHSLVVHPGSASDAAQLAELNAIVQGRP